MCINNSNQNKVAVYTAIFGNYDEPPTVPVGKVAPGVDFICFSDTDINCSPPWELVIVKSTHRAPVVINRHIKFVGHDYLVGYESIIYIDGNVVFNMTALDMIIPKLPSLYCEPFADVSQIPTFLVAQLARQHVTVSLSGDAGDELFAGYNRYVMTQNLWGSLGRVPAGLRRMAASGIRTVSPGRWNSTFNPIQRVLPKTWRLANVGDKLHKAAGVLGAQSVEDLYLGLVSHWVPEGIVIGGHEPMTILTGMPVDLSGLDAVQRMMALDAMTYLPDDILAKVDRAAMGVSLETRVPFLDHQVVEFAWRLPQHLKLRDGVGKWILRQVLYRHVPKDLIERPKMGFAVPIDRWLRGPLRDWAEDLLAESRLRQEGFFNPAPIRRKWDEHLSGKRNWQHHLWSVLMFQAWLEEQRQ